MSLPKRFLGADERVVLHLRTHGKALIGPVLVLILLLAVVSAALALLPRESQPWAGLAVAAIAIVLAIAFVLLPFLRWWTSTYTVTNRRVITRHGILNKRGHDLPLSRINNVEYEHSLTDRMLGCGTLVFSTASESPLSLPDVPHVERVHVIMTELLFGDRAAVPPARDPHD